MLLVDVEFVEEESVSAAKILNEQALIGGKGTSSKGGRKGFLMAYSAFFNFFSSFEIRVNVIEIPLLSRVLCSSTTRDSKDALLASRA